ncbi:mitochondrial carrier [Diaporthe amygdali]|uniref:mitochondrial carrier n=1 Tax=Phomopsis amygdali TaxID=1214568 RepID=UPI0022FE426B|nr:mitochondrial carrier [Diaporthe amygdali]KAJ0114324.1 mitochondrial carrier [Diaporthe amygdali]
MNKEKAPITPFGDSRSCKYHTFWAAFRTSSSLRPHPKLEDSFGEWPTNKPAFLKCPTAASILVYCSALEPGYNFALGFQTDTSDAFMVYPIDIVKTRMQNQRSTAVGNASHQNEGVLLQLVGMAPKKDVRLITFSVNKTVVSEKTNAQRKPKFLNHGYQQDGQPLNFWCNPDLKVLQKYHKKIKPDAKKPIKTVYMIRDNPESDICDALNVDETWKLT